MQTTGRATRRRVLQQSASALVTTLCAPAIARAQDVPKIRYATGGGLGANEIVTIHFMDWMRANVLERYGKAYTLDVVYTRGTPEAASLLGAGQVDLATLSLPAFATAIVRDLVPGGMKAIADDFQDARPGYAQQTFYALDENPIRTVADCRGKIIAVNAFGTSVDLVLRVILKKAGLDPRKDVRIVEISFPNIGSALREKRIDVGALPLPFGATERAKGGLREIFKGADAFAPYEVIFQAATNDFLKAHPEAVRAWLADYVDGLRWMYDPANRKTVVDLAASLSKSPPEVVDSYFLTQKDYFRDPKACIGAALFQPSIDAMVKEGLIARSIDAAAYIDTSYLPAACTA